jgi:hypothetical protein
MLLTVSTPPRERIPETWELLTGYATGLWVARG